METLSVFSSSGSHRERDFSASNHEEQTLGSWPFGVVGRSAVLEEKKSQESEQGRVALAGIGMNDNSKSSGITNIQLPQLKSPRSCRRTRSSFGAGSELQFPTFDLQSPPSPEPFGPLRPGSPLKWRSRNAAVSPWEDPGISPGGRETPAEGLMITRNPSFSEFISNTMSIKGLIEDSKDTDSAEHDRSVAVGMVNASFAEFDGNAVLPKIPCERGPHLDPYEKDYSFALEYQGPPISDDVLRVEPIEVDLFRRSDELSRQLSKPSSLGSPIPDGLTNPVLSMFNISSRVPDLTQRVYLPPSTFAKNSVVQQRATISSTPTSSSPRMLTTLLPPGNPELATHGPGMLLNSSVDDELPTSFGTSPAVGVEASSRSSSDHATDSLSRQQWSSFSQQPASNSFGSCTSESILPLSEPLELWKHQSSVVGSADEQNLRYVGHGARSMSLPGVQAAGTSIGTGPLASHRTTSAANVDNYNCEGLRRRRKGGCYLCHKGNRLTEKEFCLVCNAKYCCNCVLTAMESMPEGRKCRTCIGKPVDESKRLYIGKPSRLLNRLLNAQEVQQIMKTEKECAANQLGPEQLYVNGKQLTSEELALLLKCPNPPQKLKPGRYWYDSQSGLWGKEGERPDKLISPDLKVGGPLQENASKGSTQVYMNGRELGKLELKMLKLAGVHCPPSTHLWVEPNGSYQEEGQNNSKGNIWNKTSIRLLYPFFSLPTPGTSSRYTKDLHRDSPDIYMPDFILENKLHKILLLGHEGSGRSTLFKQTKFLFKEGFSHEERLDMKRLILCHIYRYIGILLEGRERLEEEDDMVENKNDIVPVDQSGKTSQARRSLYALDERLKQRADWFLEMMNEGSLETYLSASAIEYPLLVDELWRDPAIKATHQRKDELDILPDVADYFLDKVVEISSNEYEPSDEDILRAEGLAQGSGLADVEFSLDDKMPSYQDNDIASPGRYQLIRVGGNGMAEGCKWLDMFEDVHVVVFCVAISEYDQVLTDSQGHVSCKVRQKELFDSVLKHPILGGKPMVLLLNKYDVFEEKICKGIPLTSCEWFSDFQPVGASQNTAQMQAQQGYTYVVHKYKELFASTGHKLFTFKLNAIERDKVLEAFQYVREILKWKDNGWDLQLEESSYSTDLSSYSQRNFSTAGNV